jgi:drug/metabolite transporter (DMT)-like permease
VALLFYTSVVGTVLFGVAAPWFWPSHAPSPFEIALLASLGVYGGLGHFLFTAAFRHAPASLLAPLNYLQLLWAGLLGWLVFGHIPDRVALAGMVVVAVSGVMVALKTRRPPPKRMA